MKKFNVKIILLNFLFLLIINKTIKIHSPHSSKKDLSIYSFIYL